MLAMLRNMASRAFSLLDKEISVLHTLDRDVRVTLKRLVAEDAGLEPQLKGAYGYAIFPSIGKAAAVVGAAFGKGEVFERGELVGYGAVAQLTIGVQLGGDTLSELILFENQQALNRFKQGKVAFAAGASAVLIKAGTAGAVDYESGAKVFVHSEGGLMLEAALGGQKFFYRPAVVGKLKPAPRASRTVATRPPRKRVTKSGDSRKRSKSTRSRARPQRARA
jgi:lipid-binding SYLF domain-containing protein